MKAHVTFKANSTLLCSREKKGELRVISHHPRWNTESWLLSHLTKGKTRSVCLAGSTAAAKPVLGPDSHQVLLLTEPAGYRYDSQEERTARPPRGD